MIQHHINQKFNEILYWLKSVPQLDKLSRTELVQLMLQLMDCTLFGFRYVISLNPSSDYKKFAGYSKHRAIIIGHMVRIAKLYEGFLLHSSKGQYELAGIFTRLIYETDVRLDYFLASKNKKKTMRNFILISYKALKSQLREFDDLSKHHNKLNSLEKEIKKGIMKLLKNDGISKKELFMNKNWNLDGKDFASLLRHLNRENEYAPIFGNSSSFVHGGWHDINSFHLIRYKNHYLPKLHYSAVDLKITTATTYVCLNRMLSYIQWNKLKIENKYEIILKGLRDLASEIGILGPA